MYWHSGMFYTGTTYHTYWRSDFIILALVNVHTGISSGRFQFILGNHSLFTGTHWQPVSKCTGMRERGHWVGQQIAQEGLLRASPARSHSGGVGTIASRLTLRCPVCACTATLQSSLRSAPRRGVPQGCGFVREGQAISIFRYVAIACQPPRILLLLIGHGVVSGC